MGLANPKHHHGYDAGGLERSLGVGQPQALFGDSSILEKTLRKFGMRKKLWLYFLLLIFVFLSAGTQLILELGSSRLHEAFSASIAGQLSESDRKSFDMDAIREILTRLQWRMAGVMLVAAGGCFLAVFFFIRSIVRPLERMRRASEKMSRGCLDEPLPVQGDDEIGQIGELTNDLAMNLQEVLLHIWKHGTDFDRFFKRLDNAFLSRTESDISPEIREDFEAAKQSVRDIREMVRSFELYDIHLDDENVMAGDGNGKWEVGSGE